MRLDTLVLATSVTLLLVGQLAAQQPDTTAAAVPEYRAVRATRPPAIDGVLDDEAWSAAPEITSFTQRNPDEGKPASEQTVVRIVYDDTAIYVAARMDDSEKPTSLLGRRDNSLASDWFRFYVDPHNDDRSGAAFWVNPANVQTDMVLYNDGWNDWNWDAVWSSAAKVRDGGWDVEMRIPFSQLRFSAKETHRWGFNAIRIISRNNEEARLVHTPKNESGFVSRFADLVGIEGVHPRRSLEIVPYAVSRADFRNTVAPDDPFTSNNELKADLGVDVKYGLTSNLTLTGTINPDFGQVEVDPASVNLSQFELFFPEKRPFFIEGGNMFQFGQGGSNWNMNFGSFTPSFFYSRRIGRTPQGAPASDYRFIDAPRETTILAAGKITGRTQGGWTIAALDALTDEETSFSRLTTDTTRSIVEPMTNYLVARGAKDLGSRGRLGMLFTSVNRDLPGTLSYLRQNAYTGGIDGYWTFGDKDLILEGSIGGSLVDGSERSIDLTQRSAARYYQRPDAGHVELDPERTSLAGYMARVALVKQTGKWRYNVKADTYSPGFETNDVGFMTRTDMTNTHVGVMYSNPQPTKRHRDRGFMMAKYQNWNYDGDLIQNGLFTELWGQFLNYRGYYFNVQHQFERYDDRTTRGGPVIKQPATTFLVGETYSDSRKKFSYSMFQQNYWSELGSYDHGGAINLNYRPTSNLKLSLRPYFSRTHNAAQYVWTQGDATAMHTYNARYVFGELDQRTFELGTRLDWTFSSRLTFSMYLQPYISSGDYHHFAELSAPRTMNYDVYENVTFDEEKNRYTIDPDGAGGAAAFSFRNPDFNYRSVRGSAVLRWDFRPGSALYVVWNENRQAQEGYGDFNFSRDISAVSDIPSDDVLLLKVSYWLPM